MLPYNNTQSKLYLKTKKSKKSKKIKKIKKIKKTKKNKKKQKKETLFFYRISKLLKIINNFYGRVLVSIRVRWVHIWGLFI